MNPIKSPPCPTSPHSAPPHPLPCPPPPPCPVHLATNSPLLHSAHLLPDPPHLTLPRAVRPATPRQPPTPPAPPTPMGAPDWSPSASGRRLYCGTACRKYCSSSPWTSVVAACCDSSAESTEITWGPCLDQTRPRRPAPHRTALYRPARPCPPSSALPSQRPTRPTLAPPVRPPCHHTHFGAPTSPNSEFVGFIRAMIPWDVNTPSPSFEGFSAGISLRPSTCLEHVTHPQPPPVA